MGSAWKKKADEMSWKSKDIVVCLGGNDLLTDQ